jgi:hypothetical protein
LFREANSSGKVAGSAVSLHHVFATPGHPLSLDQASQASSGIEKLLPQVEARSF